ncbi:hypothetical protein ABPG74_020609 [Tetrahymena malaccensis]
MLFVQAFFVFGCLRRERNKQPFLLLVQCLKSDYLGIKQIYDFIQSWQLKKSIDIINQINNIIIFVFSLNLYLNQIYNQKLVSYRYLNIMISYLHIYQWVLRQLGGADPFLSHKNYPSNSHVRRTKSSLLIENYRNCILIKLLQGIGNDTILSVSDCVVFQYFSRQSVSIRIAFTLLIFFLFL